ncbi:DUF664 domain-containing protein [Streptomyces sp. NPDC048045]|uniref:mycothiol transferase n=1 Tax=Streptomyces sp. NPDC048045 TaxID=3154710 RepID=UPI0034176842
MTRQETCGTWQTEIGAARRNAAGLPLDALSRGTGRFTEEPFSPRRIRAHTVGGYARHNGNAGLARERIDGATGD